MNVYYLYGGLKTNPSKTWGKMLSQAKHDWPGEGRLDSKNFHRELSLPCAKPDLVVESEESGLIAWEEQKFDLMEKIRLTDKSLSGQALETENLLWSGVSLHGTSASPSAGFCNQTNYLTKP